MDNVTATLKEPHNRIGDVLEQGSLPAALDSYKASLAIADRLAKADPGNAGCQRDLSVSAYEITAGMVSTSGALQLRISISRSRP